MLVFVIVASAHVGDFLALLARSCFIRIDFKELQPISAKAPGKALAILHQDRLKGLR